MLDRYSDSDGESQANEDDIFLSTQRPVVGELVWRGKSFPLYEGDNLIGRDNVCEVKIDHKSISGKHAEILIQSTASSSSSSFAGDCTLRDLRSSNGTFLEFPKGSDKYQKLSVLNNGKSLEDGGKVRFGMVSCTFRRVADSSNSNQLAPASPLLAQTKPPNQLEETQFLQDITMVDEDEEDEDDESDTNMGSHRAAHRNQPRPHEADEETATEEEDNAVSDHLNANTEPVSFNDAETMTEDGEDDEALVVVPPGTTFVRVDGSSGFLNPTGSAQLPTQIDDEDLDDYRPPILASEGEGTEVGEDDEDETMSQDLMEPIAEPQPSPPAEPTPQSTAVPVQMQFQRQPSPISTREPIIGLMVSGQKSASASKPTSKRSFLEDTDTEDEEGLQLAGSLQAPKGVEEPSITSDVADVEPVAKNEEEAPTAPVPTPVPVESEPTEPVDEGVRKSGRARKTNLKFTASTDARYEKKLQEEIEEKQAEETASVAAPTPRKRKGQEVAEEVSATPQTNTSKATAGRGRGKQANQSSTKDEETAPLAKVDSLHLETNIPRRRGKGKSPEPEVSSPVKDAADVENEIKSTELEEEEAPPTKRGRGRQKQKASEALDFVAAVAEPVAVAVEAAVIAVSNSRKKRQADEITGDGPTQDHVLNEEEINPEIANPSKRSKNIANASHDKLPGPAAQSTKPEAANTTSSSSGGRGRKKATPTTIESATEIELKVTPVGRDKEGEDQQSHVALTAELVLPIRILFTKVEESTYSKQLKKIPGIEVTADARIATHCITTKELKRTPKLMVALNSSILFILNEQWIMDSAKAGRPLPVVETNRIATEQDKANYLKELQKSNYLIRDAEKEELWSFEMAQTLTSIRCSLSTKGEKQGPGIFANIAVFCTKGLCGSKAPSEEEMQQIVESGQGIWLKSLADFQNDGGNEGGIGKKKSSKGKQQAETAVPDVTGKILVVISHESLVKKEVKKDIMDCSKNSGAKGIYSVELLFQAVLRQELNLNENILDGFSF